MKRIRKSELSVLFNESKLLKCAALMPDADAIAAFSTLQRVEIAEIAADLLRRSRPPAFSTLQRVEIAEITKYIPVSDGGYTFSTLQRVEIAEIYDLLVEHDFFFILSVLFNESKLLKYNARVVAGRTSIAFSTLQRVEIAEIRRATSASRSGMTFSTLQRVEIAEIGTYRPV